MQARGRPAYATAAAARTRPRGRLFHLQPATAYHQLSHGMQARGRPVYTTVAAARTRPRPLRFEGCCRHRQAATGYRCPPASFARRPLPRSLPIPPPTAENLRRPTGSLRDTVGYLSPPFCKLLRIPWTAADYPRRPQLVGRRKNNRKAKEASDRERGARVAPGPSGSERKRPRHWREAAGKVASQERRS